MSFFSSFFGGNKPARAVEQEEVIAMPKIIYKEQPQARPAASHATLALEIAASAENEHHAITHINNQTIWSGRIFKDSGFDGSQASAERNVTLKAIWLAAKNLETCEKVTLTIKAPREMLESVALAAAKEAHRVGIEIVLEEASNTRAQGLCKSKWTHRWDLETLAKITKITKE